MFISYVGGISYIGGTSYVGGANNDGFKLAVYSSDDVLELVSRSG